MRFIVSVLLLFLMIFPTCACASEVEVVDVSYDTSVTVSFTNDENVSALHMHLDVFPDAINVLADDFIVEANEDNQQFILYSTTKQNSIPSDDILLLDYSSITSNITFVLTVLDAAVADGSGHATIDSVSSKIKLTYDQEDVTATVQRVVGSVESGGVDYDSDGEYDVVDLQNVINGT